MSASYYISVSASACRKRSCSGSSGKQMHKLKHFVVVAVVMLVISIIV